VPIRGDSERQSYRYPTQSSHPPFESEHEEPPPKLSLRRGLLAESPDTDREILASRNEFAIVVASAAGRNRIAAIGRELHSLYEAALLELLALLAGGHVPPTNRAVIAARQDAAAIRRHVHAGDDVRVSLETPHQFAAFDIPELNHRAGSADGLAIV